MTTIDCILSTLDARIVAGTWLHACVHYWPGRRLRGDRRSNSNACRKTNGTRRRWIQLAQKKMKSTFYTVSVIEARPNFKSVQICVQLLYVRWQRGTARIRPALLRQSIDISCRRATAATFAAVAHVGTDYRTPDMRAVRVNRTHLNSNIYYLTVQI